MNTNRFTQLAAEAEKALVMLEALICETPNSNSLQSLKNQMTFILANAKNQQNPLSILSGRVFTYGIISSRELASPYEMEVKAQIDKLSQLLDTLT